jgi:hypothetical protein
MIPRVASQQLPVASRQSTVASQDSGNALSRLAAYQLGTGDWRLVTGEFSCWPTDHHPGQDDAMSASIGLRTISFGFPLVASDDHETLERSAFLYDALYASLSQQQIR